MYQAAAQPPPPLAASRNRRGRFKYGKTRSGITEIHYHGSTAVGVKFIGW